MPLIRKNPTQAAPPQAAPDRDVSLAALRAGSAEERWAAARSLAVFPDAAGALGEALQAERDQRVREAILTSLMLFDTAQSFEAVLPLMRSDDADLRTAAIDALKAMKSAIPAGVEALLRDPSADIRLLACDLVRDLPPDQATEMLVRLIEIDPEVNVCASAIDVLAEIGSPAALPALERCAARFADQPFLGFAVKIASERIASERIAPRGSPR